MDASKVLSVLYSEIHSVVVGMIDSEGHPSSAFLDVMFAEENAVYFMTYDNGRKLYPDEQKEKRRIIDVFQVYEGYGSYQDFGVTPPEQTEFQFHCEIE